MFLILCFSCLSLAAYAVQFRFAVATIGQLIPNPHDTFDTLSIPSSPVISVIVPAYNEADNIQACVTSILDSSASSADALEVWVVDDQSTDHTWILLKTLQDQLQDPRLHLLFGKPRPTGEVWKGKNWACVQAVEQARGQFLLFIDADVRLKPGAIAAALHLMEKEQIDLLNCIPQVVCGSIIEWLVQPLIFISLVISFVQPAVRDPQQETAYAAGPFMLFNRTAYDQIGGHRVIAHEIAEDVALARAIKRHQFKLTHRLGSHVASLRMYTSLSSLWEGWTKVLYVGAWRNVGLMLLLVVMMLSLYTVPWLGFGLGLANGLSAGWHWMTGLSLGLSLVCLGLQYSLRSHFHRALHCPPKYWWLQGIGGLFVAVMAIASIIKAKTGWGWTWRGRPLQ